ncbi:MAG: dethiobiotin synthase [Burkholderiales bacterium]
MKAGFFVAGTDTGVGKTLFAAALVRRCGALGLRAAGMKPIAAGCDHGRNDDVEALLAAGIGGVDRRLVCPYLFEPPIAPHIAAREAGIRIDLAVIEAAFKQLQAQAELVVVEGVGGFRVPLDERTDAGAIPKRLALPVILVVGLRLGCLSHALLTREAIEAEGLELAGWVANRIDPAMARAEENIEALRSRLRAPLIAEVPFGAPSDFPIALEPLWPGRGSP